MGCRHGPQSQSGEVITTYINTVDSDLQIVQKQKYTKKKQQGKGYRGSVACQLILLDYFTKHLVSKTQDFNE